MSKAPIQSTTETSAEHGILKGLESPLGPPGPVVRKRAGHDVECGQAAPTYRLSGAAAPPETRRKHD